MIPSRLTFITLVTLLAFVLVPAALDAKRKKPTYQPPLKIVDITTAPVPFAPGHGPMAITVTVELPENVDQFDLLEVSSLISVPTRRSVRFLASRQPLNTVVIEGRQASHEDHPAMGRERPNPAARASRNVYL